MPSSWLNGIFGIDSNDPFNSNGPIISNQANGIEQQSAASSQIALQQQSAYGQLQPMNSQQIYDAQNSINHLAHQIAHMGMNFGQGDFIQMGLPAGAFMQGTMGYNSQVVLPKTIDECCNALKTYIEGRKALKCLLKV